MLGNSRYLALLLAAGVLLAALPSSAAGDSQRCKRTPKVGYVVSGTFVTGDASSVTISVTDANGHATNSGDIADQDATTEGVQVTGATYGVSGDAFKLVLEGADTPSSGDSVQIIGNVARTKAKCASDGTSLADRYAAPDVRQVVITHTDAVV